MKRERNGGKYKREKGEREMKEASKTKTARVREKEEKYAKGHKQHYSRQLFPGVSDGLIQKSIKSCFH